MDYYFLSSYENLFNKHETTININDYIKNVLNTEIIFFVKCEIKPDNYTISLYDNYEKVFWIYDEYNINGNFIINVMFPIQKCIEQYVAENYNNFRKNFIKMSLYLLNKLNNYDVYLFKTYFNEYYHTDNKNKDSVKVYINKWNKILEDSFDYPLGSYVLLYEKTFFDDMLYTYCVTKPTDRNKIDGSFIIEYINTLCK
jgi:hypothetical protein